MWINRQHALKKLSQADSLKEYKLKITQRQTDIDTLNSWIANLLLIINKLDEKEANNKQIIQQLQEQKKIMEDQKGVLLDQIAASNKRIKKLKRKQFWTAMAGTAATVGAFWIGSSLK